MLNQLLNTDFLGFSEEGEMTKRFRFCKSFNPASVSNFLTFHVSISSKTTFKSSNASDSSTSFFSSSFKRLSSHRAIKLSLSNLSSTFK